MGGTREGPLRSDRYLPLLSAALPLGFVAVLVAEALPDGVPGAALIPEGLPAVLVVDEDGVVLEVLGVLDGMLDDVDGVAEVPAEATVLRAALASAIAFFSVSFACFLQLLWSAPFRSSHFSLATS